MARQPSKLGVCVEHDNFAQAQKLLPNASMASKRLALEIAASHDKVDFVRLLAHEVDQLGVDNALTRGVATKSVEATRLLLSLCEPSLDAVNYALSLTAHHNLPALTALLLPKVPNGSLWISSAMRYALGNDFKEVIELLMPRCDAEKVIEAVFDGVVTEGPDAETYLAKARTAAARMIPYLDEDLRVQMAHQKRFDGTVEAMAVRNADTLKARWEAHAPSLPGPSKPRM